METLQPSKRRRTDCSGEPVSIENVERNNGGVDCKHKVFLCHSGEQKDFVESMHDEIERHDRSAFFDKSRRSLPLGCDFPKEIFKAIEECEVGVVVLSQAFFTKTWWLMEEFARLAKRKEENQDFVLILVYYKDIERVECRDVKKQMEWKQIWEEWARSDKRIVIEDWTFVFNLFGSTYSISYGKVGSDKRLIREVVAEVCKNVTPKTRGDVLDMQGRQRICELVWDKMQASEVFRVDATCVLGFYGMGGIGKSTLCKALCEKLRSDFGGRVCHAELASNSDEGKEKELLGEMVKRLIGTAHEVVVGYDKKKRLNCLKSKLQSEKVFVAIDNVGDGASSKKLARDLLEARFATDSFVVVTARSIEMLRDVGLSRRECHKMPELNYEEAKSLFLKNAPEGVHPEDEFTKDCVDMCYFTKGVGERYHYHPLALKILGGQLGYDPNEWMPRLKRRDLFNTLAEREHPIFSILRTRFDLLKSEDQLLFMDVALFFPERKQSALYPSKDVNIMTWLRLVHGRTDDDLMFRLEALKQKSLIECIGDGTDVVGMHDLWREFCVSETTREDSGSQRWFYRMDEMHESVNESRFYSGGWEDLQRVCLSSSDLLWNKRLEVRTVSLQCCSNLTVLKLVNVKLTNGVVDVSPLLQLKSLEVDLTGVDHLSKRKEGAVDIKGLGKLVNLRVLIVLSIPSNSACIGEIGSLVCLEVLMLSAWNVWMLSSWDSEKTSTDADEPSTDADDTVEPGKTRLPDLRDLRYLRLVSLKGVRLPNQVVWFSMKNLQCLDLGGDTGMLNCDGLEDLTGLVELDLRGCSHLEVLSYLGKLTKLKKLNISCCRVSVVPGLDCLVALELFTARCCKGLKRLPDLQRLSNLRVLDLRDSLVEPIRGLEGLTSLRQLGVHFDTVKDSPSQCPLTKLQDVEIEAWRGQGLPCMVGWTGLKRLEIRDYGARKLKGLESLSSLQFLYIRGCDFREVSIVSCLTSLQTLWIKKCQKLRRVPSLDQLLMLESLELEGLGAATWEVCGIIPQLRYLSIEELPVISVLELGQCPELRLLKLVSCPSLTRLTSDGPMAMLEDLSIYTCESLESLPSFRECTRLRRVYMFWCRSLIQVPSFSGLTRCDDGQWTYSWRTEEAFETSYYMGEVLGISSEDSDRIAGSSYLP